MAQNFPFEINADKYSRQLWSKQAYLYLAEFFRKAVFDTNVQVIEGGTIDDYRFSGPADDWRLPGRGAASGAWSGFVWYLGELKWDFSKVDADPDGEALEGGLGAALEGIYLVIELETGDFQWADSVSGIEGVSASTHSLFPVCARSGSGTEEDPYTYTLSSNRVVGDIRIEAVPYLPVAEAEET